MATTKVRVSYGEFKDRFDGFEKWKGNYNKEDKTIEIEIGEKRYANLMQENKKYASKVLYEIAGLLQPGEAEKFILIGSEQIEKALEENKSRMSVNQIECTKKALKIMKNYGI